MEFDHFSLRSQSACVRSCSLCSLRRRALAPLLSIMRILNTPHSPATLFSRDISPPGRNPLAPSVCATLQYILMKVRRCYFVEAYSQEGVILVTSTNTGEARHTIRHHSLSSFRLLILQVHSQLQSENPEQQRHL